MDQRGEKEEHSSQDLSSDHRRERKDDAAAAVAAEGVHGESTDQLDDGRYEAETAGMIKEQVEVAEEEASAPLLAHPCSLLQLLLRACAGCLVGLLHDYCSGDDPKPATADGIAAAAAVAESSPHDGEGYDDDNKKAAAGSVVTTQVLVPPPPPPGPIESSGGNGGSHN